MPSWMYFVLALAGLLAGYCVYGAIVEKVFGPDPNRPTPACKMPDGVDYVEMSPTKVFLIQLLNIAGLGPVFGPILGALYGPIALLWVVIGCVFAGAVHDYFSGMLSVRYNGKSVPDIVGYNLGDLIKKLMRVFAVVLLILVGVVFVAGPLAAVPVDRYAQYALCGDHLCVLLPCHYSARGQDHRPRLSVLRCTAGVHGRWAAGRSGLQGVHLLQQHRMDHA